MFEKLFKTTVTRMIENAEHTNNAIRHGYYETREFWGSRFNELRDTLIATGVKLKIKYSNYWTGSDFDILIIAIAINNQPELYDILTEIGFVHCENNGESAVEYHLINTK